MQIERTRSTAKAPSSARAFVTAPAIARTTASSHMAGSCSAHSGRGVSGWYGTEFLRDDPPVGGAEQRLGALCPDVDPDDVVHPRPQGV